MKAFIKKVLQALFPSSHNKIIYRLKTLPSIIISIIKRLSLRIFNFPNYTFECPVCDEPIRRWKRLRRLIGKNKYRNERECLCPLCSSFERTRHIWLFIEKYQLIKSNTHFLHVAPEKGLENNFRKKLLDQYVTMDLFRPDVDVRTDLTNMVFPDCSFSLIYCSNVLEHIEDDLKAMTELYRVLSPGGLAIIQVPIQGEKTYEDPKHNTPEERTRYYGQADHLRMYGRDILQRLSSVGFRVEEVWMPDCLELDEMLIERYNIGKRELVHFCYKD